MVSVGGLPWSLQAAPEQSCHSSPWQAHTAPHLLVSKALALLPSPDDRTGAHPATGIKPRLGYWKDGWHGLYAVCLTSDPPVFGQMCRSKFTVDY